MLFIFSTPVLTRRLWQLKEVVFLHWCLIYAVLLKRNNNSRGVVMNNNHNMFIAKTARHVRDWIFAYSNPILLNRTVILNNLLKISHSLKKLPRFLKWTISKQYIMIFLINSHYF